MADATERSEGGHQSLLCRTQRRYRVEDRLLEAIGEECEGSAVLVEDRLESRQIEPLLSEPGCVTPRPSAHPDWPLASVPEQELVDPVPGAELVLFSHLTGTDQVTQRFGRGVGNEDRGTPAICSDRLRVINRLTRSGVLCGDDRVGPLRYERRRTQMTADSGSSSGKTPSGRPERPMNYPDKSHPIFSNPIVIGPGVIWRRPSTSEGAESQVEGSPEEEGEE